MLKPSLFFTTRRLANQKTLYFFATILNQTSEMDHTQGTVARNILAFLSGEINRGWHPSYDHLFIISQMRIG